MNQNINTEIVDDRIITEQDDVYHIVKLCIPTIEQLGYRIIWVQRFDAKRILLKITVENKDKTLSLDDCTLISRNLSALFEIHDPLEQAYILEVSSPGENRMLVREEDFVRFNGAEVKIETLKEQDGKKRWKGKICQIKENQTIVIRVDDNPDQNVEIKFGNIKKAQVIPDQQIYKKIFEKAKKQKKIKKIKSKN